MLKVVALVLALLVVPATATARPDTYGANLGSHAMLYLNTDPALQEAMFRATAEAGVRYLRMDFAVSIVFQSGKPDFDSVKRVNALAEIYDVEVLGVITTTPGYIAACPAAARITSTAAGRRAGTSDSGGGW